MRKSLFYLVAEAFGGDDGDFVADSLVGFEVEGELGVVALDDDFGGFLHGLAERDWVRLGAWMCRADRFLLTLVLTRPILAVLLGCRWEKVVVELRCKLRFK